MKRPIYKKTSHGCHYGRTDPDFTWEVVKDLSHEKKVWYDYHSILSIAWNLMLWLSIKESN